MFSVSCFATDADDDKSMATEQIEPLPKMPSPVKKPAVVQNKQTQPKKTEKQEKPVKPKAKGGRTKGRMSTPERKPVRKEPVYIPREEVKKKKGSHNFVFLLTIFIVEVVIYEYIEYINCSACHTMNIIIHFPSLSHPFSKAAARRHHVPKWGSVLL